MCANDSICFFFSSRRRHTRCREVSWARRCVQETVLSQWSRHDQAKHDQGNGQSQQAPGSGHWSSYVNVFTIISSTITRPCNIIRPWNDVSPDRRGPGVQIFLNHSRL
eukprot:TRINITY_DN37970_c0_g1_i1.p1 TRINITY_DN37970_c0_g1~~TRINITY_DN37970_c0_g1_i1.p1  ORF type:complete len:108 (-),score=18.29 TRINITY_DN37970_c0_g1_i1:158-481(-)